MTKRTITLLLAAMLLSSCTKKIYIESVRTDSLMLGTMRVSQLVAVLAVIGGGILMLVLHRRAQTLPVTLLADEATPEQPAENTEKENLSISNEEE